MDIAKLEAEFLEKKAASEIFDINFCMTNYTDDVLSQNYPTPEEAIKSGKTRLVLTDTLGMTEAFKKSNETVLAKAAENDAFYAAVTVVPEMALGGGDFRKTLDDFINRKAVICRMFPKKFKHSVKKWQIGDILREMEARRIPLMLWHMEVSWDAMAEIADSFPSLPIIIEGSDQKTLYYMRDIMGICEKHENIYLEMHNFTQYLFLPYALEFIGAHRLLFGSRTPFCDGNGPLGQIFAHADEKQQKAILGGNMDRLLREMR